MHAQYFALLNFSLKLQCCGEASLEFLLKFPEPTQPIKQKAWMFWDTLYVFLL